MIFSSKGFKGATAAKGAALEAALLKASEGGKLPIVCDTSPCLAQIKGDLTDGSLKCVPASTGTLHCPNLVYTLPCAVLIASFQKK